MGAMGAVGMGQMAQLSGARAASATGVIGAVNQPESGSRVNVINGYRGHNVTWGRCTAAVQQWELG